MVPDGPAAAAEAPAAQEGPETEAPTVVREGSEAEVAPIAQEGLAAATAELDVTEEEPAVGPAPTRTSPPSANAAFVLEEIVVEGVKHGSGKSSPRRPCSRSAAPISEGDLQQALHRIERLPFVVSADFALRRGSERGRFALVVKVVETMPVFAGGDLGIYVYSGSRQVMATEVAYVALPEVVLAGSSAGRMR